MGWSPRVRCVSIQVTQPAVLFCWNRATSAGRYSRELAKITGMTPAVFTLIGMYVLVPPYIRRPTMRLAYWTGIRRCDSSTKMTSAMTTRPSATTIRSTSRPLLLRMFHMEPGKPAAMDVKISSDMPLPTPFSVTTSPSHMISPVPAVSVMIMMRMVTMLSLGTRSDWQLVNRPPGQRDEGPEPEHGHDPHREEQLAPQVRRSERPGERG